MTGEDKVGRLQDSRIQLATQQQVPFDVYKEKGVFFEAQNEFMRRDNAASTSDVPLIFD